MSVQWLGTPLEVTASRLEDMSKNIAKRAHEELKEVAKEGETKLKGMIRAKGTGKGWYWDYGGMAHGHPGRLGGYGGRVASGKMLNAVTSEVRAGGSSAEARIGWVKEYEDYFGYQETGFSHQVAGAVAGMENMSEMMAWASERLEGLFKFMEEEVDKAIA